MMEEFVAFETVVYKAEIKSIAEGEVEKEVLERQDHTGMPWEENQN